jgi:hypothetical protein
MNPKTRRARLSRWTAAILVSSTAGVIMTIAAIHLTSILSLSLPTTFSALAAPLAAPLQPELQQQAAATANNTGSVAGSVFWADGAASPGITVTAIATSTAGLESTSWVMGKSIAGTAVTDRNGIYRIENLPAGLYHIVTGPVYLPRTFSDVSERDSKHLATVTAGKTSGDMNFTCVRNSEGVIYDSSRMLTVTGEIVVSPPGKYGVHLLVNNADGSVSRWQFRDGAGRLYWWPGLDAGRGGAIDRMAEAGETVTVTGTDTGYSGRMATLHILFAREVTRGGKP